MTPETFKKAYTNTYWVQFSDRSAGCITVGADEDPVAVAGAFGQVKEIDSLPYPASPILRQRELTADEQAKGWGHCPDFCHSPRQCKGRTSCPQSYACSE